MLASKFWAGILRMRAGMIGRMTRMMIWLVKIPWICSLVKTGRICSSTKIIYGIRSSIRGRRITMASQVQCALDLGDDSTDATTAGTVLMMVTISSWRTYPTSHHDQTGRSLASQLTTPTKPKADLPSRKTNVRRSQLPLSSQNG
jgi:hypothetical protein